MKGFFRFLILAVLIFAVVYEKGNDIATLFQKNGEVTNYIVNIATNSNGTLRMNYNIGLNFYKNTDSIKIKVPNDNLEILSKDDCIKEIKVDTFGNYIEVKFDRTYKEKENLNFKFSLNQSKVYYLKNKDQLCVFRLKAMKIRNFDCEKIKVAWQGKDVFFSGISKDVGDKNVYDLKTNFIYTLPIVAQYQTSSLNLSPENKKEFSVSSIVDSGFFYLIIVGVVIIGEVIISRNSYSQNRGFVYN